MPTQLTNLDRVKRYLKINAGETKVDDVLNDLLNACSEEIRQYCQTDFDMALYNEVYDGSGNSYIQLAQFPIREIRSFSVNNITMKESVNGGWGYLIEDRCLANALGYWPYGKSCVKVSYVAGYDEVPQDVQQACVYMVSLRYRKMESIGLMSKSSGNGATDSFDPMDIPQYCKDILNKYIEPDLVLPNRSTKIAPPPPVTP